jgi:hypothetical protein
MISARGGAVLGAGGALIASWLALGEIELLAMSAILLAGVALALFLTHWNSPRLSIERHLHPNLVHEGERSAVELHLTNLGTLPLFHLVIADGVDNLGTARFAIGGLGGGEQVRASYRILCRPRGVYQVGPVQVRLEDPLGLAYRQLTAGPVDELVVYPAVEELTGFPALRGRDPSMKASRPDHNQQGGEDFYTLRAYLEGDDLRRVHWPTSAKVDDLMIRQMENPWQSRALVFFDGREHVYDDEDCFEKAVSGAASVVKHLLAGGFAGDLWSGGSLTDFGRYSAVMEALALARPMPLRELRGVAVNLRLSDRGGMLVMVTGRPDQELVGFHRLLSQQHPSAVLLAARTSPDPLSPRFRAAGVKVVAIGGGQRWAPEWNQTMGKVWAPASAG